MKVLWISNIVMPELAKHLGIAGSASGSWLVDIADGLSRSEKTDIAVACVWGNEFKKLSLNNKTYYLLPGNGKNMLFYTKKFEKLWRKICEDFKPDIVHIHGTEYSHGLAFMRANPGIPSIISIQGILNRIKDVDFAGIPLRHYIFGRTLKQWLKINGEIETHFIHKKNAKYEKEMFSRAQAVNGVNVWDTSIAKSINPKLKIFTIEYNLRDEFYSSPKWDIENVERHSIFTNPGGTPLKGLHQLIRAAALLKNKYPDIKIKVPGMSGKNGNVNVVNAYTRYLYKLIKSLGMENHVEFLGRQTGQQMINNALSANITVVPSAIEGTSLVLRESMFLGCPCIASFRGGMADFISDKNDGYLYDYPEYTVLAERIDSLFSSDALCAEFSEKAKEKAELAHRRKENVVAYEDMYKVVLNDRV